VNAVAVAQIVAGTAGGFIGGDAGNILRGIGALGKGGTTTTNRTGTPTNAPATNTIGNILQALPGLLQKPGETNSAKTNAPAEKRNRGFNLNELLK
jgi:hypothetical protein